MVDAVCFEGAPPRTRQLLSDADADQLLLRALLFRTLSDLVRDRAVTEQSYKSALALLDTER